VMGGSEVYHQATAACLLHHQAREILPTLDDQIYSQSLAYMEYVRQQLVNY